jgi:NADP-dependent 3-hydroxy acid dehydrogenase YdfG
MTQKSATALISGASSGIGLATAHELFARGVNLILLARRKEKLGQIAQELLTKSSAAAGAGSGSGEKPWVRVIAADVSDAQALQAAVAAHLEDLKHVNILVNAAGLAIGVDNVDTARLSDWDQMIDTNVKGLMHLTRHLLPVLRQNSKSIIVNIGSVAGRWVYPGGAVYCASKFAVRAFTEGLRQDLLGSGIRVCNIEPGMVQTDFSLVRLGDQAKADAVYAGMTPLTGRDIAQTIAWVIEQPAHVNIQELVIYPTDQAHVGQVHRQP